MGVSTLMEAKISRGKRIVVLPTMEKKIPEFPASLRFSAKCRFCLAV